MLLWFIIICSFIYINSCYFIETKENYQNFTNTRTLNIGFLWPKGRIGHAVFSVFEIGLEKAKFLLPGYEIHYSMEDTTCNPKVGMKAVLKLQNKYKQLDAIIGPRCSIVCKPVGLLAAAWNIPQISDRCISSVLSNKKMYPTFTSVRGQTKALSKIFQNIFQIFDWRRITIVTSDYAVFKLAAEYQRTVSEEQDIDVQIYTFLTTVLGGNTDQNRLDVLRMLVTELKQTSRVTLMYMYDRDVRNFLVLAKQEGLLNGDHVFIGVYSTYRVSLVKAGHTKLKEHTELFQGVIVVTEDQDSPAEEHKSLHNLMLSSLSQKNQNQDDIETLLKEAQPYTGEKYTSLYCLSIFLGTLKDEWPLFSNDVDSDWLESHCQIRVVKK